MTDQLDRQYRIGLLLFLIASLATVANINADPFSLATIISASLMLIMAAVTVYLAYRMDR